MTPCERAIGASLSASRIEEIYVIKIKRASSPIYNLLPTEVEGFDSLAEPALDLRWSWNHSADEVWSQLDVSAAACTCFADRSRLFQNGIYVERGSSYL